MYLHLYNTVCHDITRHDSKHAHIFFFFVMNCIHSKCYTPSDVHLIMCALCEQKWLKELMHQKRNKVLFLNVFPLCFFKNFVFKKISLVFW